MCYKLSGIIPLFLLGVFLFDDMPYCTSPNVQHNPKIYDLLGSISTNNREHELFAQFY